MGSNIMQDFKMNTNGFNYTKHIPSNMAVHSRAEQLLMRMRITATADK